MQKLRKTFYFLNENFNFKEILVKIPKLKYNKKFINIKKYDIIKSKEWFK